jgi:hypothetical protein
MSSPGVESDVLRDIHLSLDECPHRTSSSSRLLGSPMARDFADCPVRSIIGRVDGPLAVQWIFEGLLVE